MSDQPLFSLTVTMTGDTTRTGLLSLASVLHRRAVDVLEVDLRRPVDGQRTFTSTVSAGRQRMNTLVATLLNEVDVLTADYIELLDFRQVVESAPIPHGTTRQPAEAVSGR